MFERSGLLSQSNFGWEGGKVGGLDIVGDLLLDDMLLIRFSRVRSFLWSVLSGFDTAVVLV
jgi:hypothetical protein